MSAKQSIVFDGGAASYDQAPRFSYPITRPPCQVGDLLLTMIATGERINGLSALVKNTGDMAAWTGVLTDGYSEFDTHPCYILDDGHTTDNREFWTVLTKIADAADALPGDWTVPIKGAIFGGIGGSDYLVSHTVAYRGAASIASWVAQASYQPGVDVVDCGDLGYGKRYFDPSFGGIDWPAGISIELAPTVGTLPLLVCGGMVFFSASALVLTGRAPLVNREAAATASVAGAWAEDAPLVVNMWDPHHVGHDTH